jgi:GH18 family chitinase
MTLVLAVYAGGMRTMNKEIAEYINTLLADRERLLDERKDDGKDYELNFVLKQETKSELANIYQAQKAMDYIIEESN